MRKRHALLSFSVVVVSLIFTVPGAPTQANAAEPSIVTISGAGPQGRWFKLASLFAKVLGENIKGVTFNGVTGKGVSIGNLKRINAGIVQGGLLQFLHLSQALEHTESFKNDPTQYDNVRVWFDMSPNLVRVVADAKYRSISDLKAKKISIGARGSGDDQQCRILLNAHGLTTKNTNFVYMTRTDAVNALINKQIDGFCEPFARNNRGYLSPLFSARPIGKDVDFVRPDKAALETIAKKYSYFYVDCKGEPVFGRPHLCGMAYTTGAAVSAKLPENLVYQMTKTLFSHWKEVQEGAPWLASHPGAVKAADITYLPYHPGAIKYYKEVGAWQKSHSR